MHRYSAPPDGKAGSRSGRLRALVLIAAAAVSFGLHAAREPGNADSSIVFSAAHAAETPRAERTQEKVAPRAKRARGPRDFGREGDPKKATRTIRIEMSDAMRYFPEHVTVKKGQTVRFAVRNAGALPHEMVIGTMDDLKKHVQMMKRDAELTFDDANIARVDPGQTGRIVWQFTRAGEFYYGCLVPGHFEAGMIGTIVVR
jgi:uncharacterized cupredoxin-like copper-binding protein